MSIFKVISTHDLTKVYRPRKGDVAALDGITLDVPAGSVFGLLSPNGAGKTTLIKILLGLHAATSGSCVVFGQPPDDHLHRRRIGYLPEQLKIPDYYKPQAFLRDMALLNDFCPADLETRIVEVLDTVGLSEARNKRVREFSKGMVQRLGLAQALIHDPDLLMLDEPTDGLDPLGRKHVRDLISRLRAEGKTIFLNSHLLSEIELICDEIAVLKNGKLARRGKLSDFTISTGEYRIRLAGDQDVPKRAASYFAGSRYIDGDLFVRPRGVGELNQIIDRLRAESMQIEAVEPLRETMEDAFLAIINAGEYA
jgi:ABC-2 type transport system ATP-binding protein